jgi:DNA-binding Lrp family transcriptional regulator
MQDLDEYDKKLLRLLQENNKITADELGVMVNLSTSAVQRRLKRLRSERIIEADVSVVSPGAAGIGLTCVVDLILEDGSSKAVDKFKIAMKKKQRSDAMLLCNRNVRFRDHCKHKGHETLRGIFKEIFDGQCECKIFLHACDHG